MTTTETAIATLVAADAVDKLAALEVVSRALGAPITGGGTPSARIRLADDAWIEIDIPKFGEPPPLAVDVHVVGGVEDARRHARRVLAVLRAKTEWNLSTDFDRGLV